MPELKLSDLPKPASVQDSVSQLADRVDRVLLYNARRARKLEVDFAKDAEGAMMVAMCKLELCLRNKNAGGNGDIARIIKAPPEKVTVWFTVNGTDHDEFDDPGTAYDEPYTKFDQAFKPPDPIPSAGWTLLSNRDLVNKAILSWVSKNIIGTDLKMGEASLLMGGHYALLLLAWGLGIGVFIYIGSLLLGLGVPLAYLLTIAAGLGIVGAVYGLLKPLDCHQAGDYDMTMIGLFPIIYRYGSLLTEESYDHILHHLLGKHVSGGATNVHDIYHVCGKKVLPAQILPSLLGETENHILMIETSRFLTNQLLLKPNPHAVPQVTPTYNADFDNAKNGMREWMLKHLQKYLQNDFWEFNARPYARLIPVALQNLFEFSADPDVSKAARIVLDYLSAKFAVTSNGSRRAVPFRRLAGQRDKSALFHADGDEETLRFLILAGDTRTLRHTPPGGEPAVLVTESYTLVCAGLGPYRVPDLLLDLILMKGHNRYLQRIRHGAWAHGYGDPAMEISYNSAAYLITGGGLFADAKGEEQGWALPTTLMPTAPHGRSTDWKDFIRIEGTIDETRRANTGVAPGFACGLNPFYPDWLRYPANPFHVDDSRANWIFINCASDVRPFGLYVAVFRAKCDTSVSKKLAGSAGTFGFFAVVETENQAEPLGSFTDFIEEVMSLNGSKTYTAEGVSNFLFPTGKGSDVDFVCLPTKDGAYRPRLWPIVKINGEAFGRDLDQWDLATSEVFTPSGVRTHLEDFIIRSEKHFGCVMIDNPAEDARLVLDLSDALHPRSAYVKEHRFDAGCRCPLSNECERLHPMKSLP